MAVFSKNTLNRFIHALTSQGAATEFFNTYNVTTKGTAEASKAVVLDASKGIGTITSATITTLTSSSIVNSAALALGAGAGITDGTGTIYKNSLTRAGGIYTTELLIDLTGLGSSTTDLDIIGTGTGNAHIAKLTAAECGTTILAVSMQCLEAPAGGVNDIDLFSGTVATGKFDDASSGLTGNQVLITSGGAWTNGATKAATTAPAATDYIYLMGGAGGTASTYTAGKFLISIYGY